MPILYDEFGTRPRSWPRSASSTAASSRDDGPVSEAAQAAAYKRASSSRTASRTWQGCCSSIPTTSPADSAGSRGSSTPTGRWAASLEPVRAAMEAAGASEVGPCPVTATVSAASRLADVRSRSDASAPAPTGPGSCACLVGTLATVVTGRAAAKRRAQVQPSRPRSRPAGTSCPFVDEARPGRPVERVEQPFLRVSSPPRFLPAAEATTRSPHVSGWSRRRRRTARGPGLEQLQASASAPSGSRAPGSRVSRRRPRRIAVLAASSMPATRGSSRRLPPWFIHDAADGRGATSSPRT